LGKKNQNSD
jgi:hypothetical protein